MQPGNYGPGQDPYGQQPQYGSPQYPTQPSYGQPDYGQQQPYVDQSGYGQPPYSGQPYYGDQPQYADPYAPQYPTSASPYPASNPPYPAGQQQPAPDQNWYTVPGYGAAPAKNTQAQLGMIFGIVALPLTFCCWILSIGFGIAGLVLGGIGLKNANAGAPGRGQALSGIICGAIALVVAVLVAVFSIGLSLNDQL